MGKKLVLKFEITRVKIGLKDCYVYDIQEGNSAKDIIKSLDQFLDKDNVIAEVINKLVIGKLLNSNKN